MNVEEMIRKFSQAGLVLEIAKQPFSRGRGAEDVFGLDIQRKFRGNSRSEVFRMWPGHEDNLIQVMDINKEFGQLVLAVKEDERDVVVPAGWSLERDVKRKGLTKYLQAHPENRGRIFVQDGKVFEKGKTPANRRCMLLGFDERQLFMATLPRNVTTVKQAHESLKSTRLTTAEGPQRGLTKRQGEWFFVHPSTEEINSIEEKLKKNQAWIQRKSRVFEAGAAGGGKPHVADELVRIPGSRLEHGFAVRQREEVYVRGAIHHPDHKTVKFATWRKVLRNNEGRGGAVGGGTWID